jgi:Cu/Ag efflux protein CusF
MKHLYAGLFVPLLTVGVLHAQTSTGPMPMPEESASAAAASMPLTEGEVMRVDRKRGEFVLKHGDLPKIGMPAMTMAFSIPDKATFDKFKQGDKVRFNAEMVKGKPTVTHIEPAP